MLDATIRLHAMTVCRHEAKLPDVFIALMKLWLRQMERGEKEERISNSDLGETFFYTSSKHKGNGHRFTTAFSTINCIANLITRFIGCSKTCQAASSTGRLFFP